MSMNDVMRVWDLFESPSPLSQSCILSLMYIKLMRMLMANRDLAIGDFQLASDDCRLH